MTDLKKYATRSNAKKLLVLLLYVGLWSYPLYHPIFYLQYKHIFLKDFIWYMIYSMPLLATLTASFKSLLQRLSVYGSILLLQYLYFSIELAWSRGFGQLHWQDPLGCHTALFGTVVVIEAILLFFYCLGRKHSCILIFTMPFIISCYIGLIHMWTSVLL